MRSQVCVAESFNVGGLVHDSFKDSTKKVKCFSTQKILSIDIEAVSLTIPVRAGKIIFYVVEDIRAAIYDNDIAFAIRDSIDDLEFSLSDVLEWDYEEPVCSESVNYSDDGEPPCDLDIGHGHKPSAKGSIQHAEVLDLGPHNNNEDHSSVTDEYPITGDRVKIYRTLDH